MSLVSDLGSEWYDASKITEYKLCPRKYYFRYERGLVKKGEVSTPLLFGVAYHKALEELYRGRPLAEVNQAFLDLFPPEAESKDRTRENGLRLIASYIAKWRHEDFEILAEPELAFHFRLGDFEYVGRIDLLTQSKDGVIRPMDHKTVSRYDQSFELGYKIDIAQTGYIIGARQVTGEPVREAIISASRVTSKITDESFTRKFTTRWPWEFEEWTDEVLETVEDIQRDRARGVWRKHAPSACFAYNHVCPYFGLCTSKDKEELINSAYEVSVWEPV